MQKEYIMTKREMEAYCGDTKQIFGIQECRLEGGKATGTKAFHVRNGKGIETLILADKCLGIGQLFFKGTNIGFLSKAGIVAPQFFSEEGTRGFLRTFEAGFLTTCGLSYMGQPSEVNGQKNGLHGVISNIPVESLSSDVVWSENGDAVMLLTGKASEGYLFGPNLEIRKTILIHTEQNRLEIHDRVDNKGFSESPLMLLYHMNFGYPMLDENVQIYNNYDLSPEELYLLEYISDMPDVDNTEVTHTYKGYTAIARGRHSFSIRSADGIEVMHTSSRSKKVMTTADMENGKCY